MRKGILVGAALLLAGCGSQEKQAVRDLMRDPDATQFKDFKRCPGDSAVWQGEANGKNALGAYVGFKAVMSDGVTAGFAGDPAFEILMERCFRGLL